MNEPPAPSVFEAFNARFLEPEEVAASFIPPDHFWKLCQPCHSIVLGPRGSGKTSLLKMLQTRALLSWQHPRSGELRNSLNFIGVFVPTDIVWNEQLKHLGQAYLHDDERQALAQSALTLHVLKAFTSALVDVNHARAEGGDARIYNYSFQSERTLVDELASIWHVTPKVSTFSGLRNSLGLRLSDIGYFVADERFRPVEGRSDRMRERGLLFPSFLEVLRPALDVLDGVGLPGKGKKWALCFDELELAPSTLQTDLIRYLRSTEPRLYFKLSMSPFTKTAVELAESQTKPDEDDDFNLIPLWFAEKKDSSQFSYDFGSALLKQAKVVDAEPRRYFGESYLSEEEKSAYAPNSQHHAEILRLRAKDPTFRDYLDRNGVDVNRLHKMEEETRARLIRKPYPVIVHRNYFRRFPGESQKDQQSRSRKSIALYTGWDSIAAMCEGNPRWLKGIILNIVTKVPANKKMAPRRIQSEQIEEARHRFRAKLKTIKITASGKDRGVLRLLDIVGGYFRRQFLDDRFRAEPASSFVLDEAAAGTYADAVGSALNAGAIVYLPGDRNKLILNTLQEKRFRLAYLFATEYRIPLRIGIPITLTEILSRDRDATQRLLTLETSHGP
jgi:hypothetical protein